MLDRLPSAKKSSSTLGSLEVLPDTHELDSGDFWSMISPRMDFANGKVPAKYLIDRPIISVINHGRESLDTAKVTEYFSSPSDVISRQTCLLQLDTARKHLIPAHGSSRRCEVVLPRGSRHHGLWEEGEYLEEQRWPPRWLTHWEGI